MLKNTMVLLPKTLRDFFRTREILLRLLSLCRHQWSTKEITTLRLPQLLRRRTVTEVLQHLMPTLQQSHPKFHGPLHSMLLESIEPRSLQGSSLLMKDYLVNKKMLRIVKNLPRMDLKENLVEIPWLIHLNTWILHHSQLLLQQQLPIHHSLQGT
jgi:hypothetical protein